MPVQTVYKCDQCSSESLRGETYVEVKLSVARIEVRWPMVSRNKMLCQACADNFGLPTPLAPKIKEEPAPEPTFEDLVRAIVGDELSARGLD